MLDAKGRSQVCSQLGRRLSKVYKQFDDDNEIVLGEMVFRREMRKETYASGKSEMACYYTIDKLAHNRAAAA
jgi:hypothetical protein